jgi:hypothetical protein
MMLLSVSLAAATYIGIQLAWYSPFFFGGLWRHLQPEELPLGAVERLTGKSGFLQRLFDLGLPAFLTAGALFVLRGLLPTAPPGRFLFLTLLFAFGSLGTKYFLQPRSLSARALRLSLLQDAAQVFSILGAASAIIARE